MPSSYSLAVLLGLVGAWGAAYVLVASLGGQVRDWRDPWQPPADAYRDLATPRRLGAFGRGLVSAVPVNVLLITVASFVAARLGYSWLGGSEGRDDAYRFTLAVLPIASVVPTSPGRDAADAQSPSASVIIVQKVSLPAASRPCSWGCGPCSRTTSPSKMVKVKVSTT